MFVAKVTGTVISTQKVDSLVGNKLLIVEPFRIDASGRRQLVSTGRTFIAVDALGAGVGEYVLITQGSSARLTPETKNLPVDCVIVGIVDRVQVEAICVYSREDHDAHAAAEVAAATHAIQPQTDRSSSAPTRSIPPEASSSGGSDPT
jgi:ethanolamine utilization protein EutN